MDLEYLFLYGKQVGDAPSSGWQNRISAFYCDMIYQYSGSKCQYIFSDQSQKASCWWSNKVVIPTQAEEKAESRKPVGDVI